MCKPAYLVFLSVYSVFINYRYTNANTGLLWMGTPLNILPTIKRNIAIGVDVQVCECACVCVYVYVCASTLYKQKK